MSPPGPKVKLKTTNFWKTPLGIFILVSVIFHILLLFCLRGQISIKKFIPLPPKVKLSSRITRADMSLETAMGAPLKPAASPGGKPEQGPAFLKYGYDAELFEAKKKYIPEKIWNTGGRPDLVAEERSLKEAIQKEPKNTEAMYLLGLNYFQRELYDDCRDKLEGILKIEPDNERALETNAYISLSLNRSEEAMEMAEAGLKYHPQNPRLLYIYGSGVLYADGDVETARKYLEKAMKLDRRDPLIRIILAESYFIEGTEESVEKGFSIFHQALKDFPDYHLTYSYLAEKYLLDRGNGGRAIELAQKAISINPREHRPYLVIGDVYMERMEYNRALDFYRRAMEAGPKVKYYGEALMRMGDAYMSLKNMEMAGKFYREALEHEEKVPEDTEEKGEAYFRMADYLVEQGKLDEAKKCLDSGFETAPYMENRYLSLARWLMAKGDLKQAKLTAMKTLDTKNKGDIRTLRDDVELLLARISARCGDKKEALEHLEKMFKYIHGEFRERYIKKVKSIPELSQLPLPD